MSEPQERGGVLLGAVAYDPKVVTIWDGFRVWLRARGLEFDYVLYSNYERQVEDLVAGRIDVAWNSPLAWVRARRLAAARGIADGDVVRVFNDRGQLLAVAKLTEDIRPGVIRVNEGGWFDPLEPDKVGSLCKYGDVNNLTLDIGTSRLGQGNCGHTMLADIEKYKGTPPEVTAFAPPVGSA